jgi:hypothetical protein
MEKKIVTMMTDLLILENSFLFINRSIKKENATKEKIIINKYLKILL